MNKYLYDVLAKRWPGSVWIYSDPHFGDADMSKLRTNYVGDDQQVKNINSKVGKNDTIIFLGDIGDIKFIKKIKGYKILIMGNHEKGASNYIRKIIEKKHNSDTCPVCGDKVVHDLMTAYNCGYEYAWCNKCGTVKPKDDVYDDNHLFDEVYEGPLMINDRIILSHEPIKVPSYMFNLHGHTHDLPYQYEYKVIPDSLDEAIKLVNDGFKITVQTSKDGKECIVLYKKDNRHINVCAEAINYKPINLTKLIKEGLLKNVNNIHRSTIDKAIVRKQNKE